MKNETAIKLVRDACSKQPEDGKFVLYENDIELIAQGFNHIVRAEALEDAVKFLEENGMIAPNGFTAAGIRGLK